MGNVLLIYEHTVLVGDNIGFHFPIRVGDQEGKGRFAKSTFANLLCPEICPLLPSVVLDTFTFGFKRTGAKETLKNNDG